MAWNLLNRAYKENGIVPVLGAGVSARSGLPEWTELLRRVGEHCGTEGAALVTAACQEGFSLPAVAAMLRVRCPEGQDFTELVRRELYRKLPDEIRKAERKTARSVAAKVACVQEQNLTLRAVAALCAIATGKRPPFTEENPRFKSNPLIHAVVTFNVDAVLRAYVAARYDTALVRSVERASKEPMKGRINLYYMHGFLRYDHGAGKAGREGADKLVLAEQEYFDFFNNPTGMFNYTFLNLLRERVCVFIGASMKDDNIRRLLHYSTKERVRAFEEENVTPVSARARAIRHFAVLKHYDLKVMDAAVEASLKALGTRVLWVDAFDEIPTRLGEMYKTAGSDWRAVHDARPPE